MSQPSNEQLVPICDIQANQLDTETHLFTISSTASPCHIRLVDCQALTEQGVLRIVECKQFPTFSYSAISYPWRGVQVDSKISGSTFAVEGALAGDPVGVDVLRHACAASMARDNPYLWLDRLCIIQNNRQDKDWQIKHMYNVYKSCRLCIVVAGGVQRLVRLDEETSWIHRSWTLQEVLAPPEVIVLFDWKLGSGECLIGGKFLNIDEVIPNESAIAPLTLVLQACTIGSLSFRSTSAPNSSNSRSLLIEASMFSAQPTGHSYNDIPFWRPQRKLFAPNVAALSAALDPIIAEDSDARAHAVWQSALMRTSSRPVDMVLSIMGLFGVTLDPATFGKDDDARRQATIALASAILDAGGSASWIGAGCRVGPDRALSTFPTFPQTTVAGVALVRTKLGMQEVSELIDPVYPVPDALVPLPKGRMDTDGCFTFPARATRAYPVADDQIGEVAFDGSLWVWGDDGEKDATEEPLESHNPPVWAAVLGWFNQYHPGVTPAHDVKNIRVMLLVEHYPGVFRILSFLALNRSYKTRVLGWAERIFCVGGTVEGDRQGEISAKEEAMQTYSQRDPPWPRIPGRAPIITAVDEAIMKARWAVPQRSLERNVQKKSS